MNQNTGVFAESDCPAWCVILLVWMVFSAIFLFIGTVIWPSIANSINHVLFIIYGSLYFAMWAVYFLSRSGPKFFRVGSLRRLLLTNSKSWGEEAEEFSMDKAKQSMTAIAVLITVSFLQMVQTKEFYYRIAEEQHALHSWDVTILTMTLLCSLGAFINFIVSLDSLDCMFNDFSEQHGKLRRYFYRSTINPRYFGLVFLITALILLISHVDLLLGSIAIAIVITIGYGYWFPSNSLLTNDWNDRLIHSGFWIRLSSLCMPPLLLTLFF
ncbi:MAG: hypothetical protein ACU841_14530 [Gammaproteobacteria bacterium]